MGRKDHVIHSSHPKTLCQKAWKSSVLGYVKVSVVKERIQDFVSNERFDVVFCITVLQDIEENDRESIIKKLLLPLKNIKYLSFSM